MDYFDPNSNSYRAFHWTSYQDMYKTTWPIYRNLDREFKIEIFKRKKIFSKWRSMCHILLASSASLLHWKLTNGLSSSPLSLTKWLFSSSSIISVIFYSFSFLDILVLRSSTSSADLGFRLMTNVRWELYFLLGSSIISVELWIYIFLCFMVSTISIFMRRLMTSPK